MIRLTHCVPQNSNVLGKLMPLVLKLLKKTPSHAFLAVANNSLWVLSVPLRSAWKISLKKVSVMLDMWRLSPKQAYVASF